MTWEWVTLILGIILLVVSLFAFVAWTTMKKEINARYPKTLAEMIAINREQKETESSGTEADTQIQPKWPEGFTGKESDG